VIDIYEKYKAYFIVGVICFALGFGVQFLSGRGQLQSLRVRAESVNANYNRVRNELESSQKQLADLQKAIGAAGETVAGVTNTASNAAKSTNDIEKSNREIRESVNTAIREIESSGDEFRDVRRILETVQKRGGGKD
jgi:septal ring factor EnvC (AmiA/AmiB activator)